MPLPSSSLTMLRTFVDVEPYTPDEDAPRWLLGMARIAAHAGGVLALIGPAGLSIAQKGVGRTRANLDAPSLYLCGLVDRLRSTGRHVAIGLPPAARHLPLLLAASSVLANVVDPAPTAHGRGDGSVLIVSPDLDARARYGDLFVDNQMLDAAYPGSRMRPDGLRVMLRPVPQTQNTHGVCFFLPNLSLPASVPVRPSLIICDGRYARWVSRITDLTTWAAKIGNAAGVVVLYTIGDSDTREACLQAGFTDFPFDHAAIQAATEHTQASTAASQIHTIDWDTAVAPSFLSREHDIALVPKAAEVDRAITAARRIFAQHAREDGWELRRARWIFATLAHLPVPVVVYEYSARSLGRRTLRSLIEDLGSGSSPSAGYGKVAVSRMLKDALDGIYQALWDSNPHDHVLRSLLPAIAAEEPGQQILVLVRDRVTQRALQSWLADEAFREAPWLPNLDIRSCAEYFSATATRYINAILFGGLPRRYTWICGARLGLRVTFVAYPHEVELIRHQLDLFYSDESASARASGRDTCIGELSNNLPRMAGSESTLPQLILRVPAMEPAEKDGTKQDAKKAKARAPRMTIRDLSQLQAALEQATQPQHADVSDTAQPTFLQDDGLEEPPDIEGDERSSGTVYGSAERISCRRVRVNSRTFGRGSMWLPQDRPVEVFRKGDSDALMFVPTGSLRPGDVLLIMRDHERTSLFDRIVGLAEDQPEMRDLAARRKVWQEAVRRMARRFQFDDRVDYPILLRALQRQGATIRSELAVRFWVQGYVIGPENVRSIVAVGRVSATPELASHAHEFDQVFRTIRGIRQGIGMRLSNTIRQAFKHAVEGAPIPAAATFDDRLGIAIDELLDSIDLAEIISVEATTQMIAGHLVLRFQQP